MTTATDPSAQPVSAGSPAVSVLFPRAAPRSDERAEPDPSTLVDLNLDQVVAAVTRWRDEYDLAPLFRRPVRDPAVIAYRHEVMRDLDAQPLVDAILAFARGMRVVRQHRSLAHGIHNRHEEAIWLLEAARTYTTTVRRLSEAMTAAAPGSRGLRAVTDHLADHVASAPFAALVDDIGQVARQLSEVTFSLHIAELRVTVGPDEEPLDYGEQVEATFERFRQVGPDRQRREAPPSGKLNDVETAVLDRVARLHPQTFDALDAFRRQHADPRDPTVVVFDREIQFYLAYHDHIAPLRAAGLPFSYPEISTSRELVATGAFDLALAGTLGPRAGRVVLNDIDVTGRERILVVSGANQGGKTTFARTVGQLHHLAALGCPVPARSARLSLPDRIFTHFAHEERLEDRRGRLQDDLIRVRDVLRHATGDSLVILNEIFSSTTLADARELGGRVLEVLERLDALAVYVTFVDELAAFGPTVVSMVATVDPDDPAVRTFEVVRRPADGRAFARALADKHGLTYEQLRERLRP